MPLTKVDARQVINRAALTNVGTPAGEELSVILSKIDAAFVSSTVYLKLDGTNSPSAGVNWGNQNLTNVNSLIASTFTTRAAIPSATGTLRFGNTDSLSWRNAANSADVPVTVDASNNFKIGANLSFTSTSSFGVLGTITNDNAAAGNVGQYIVATASSSGTLGGNTSIVGTSIPLTPGDWDVTANVYFVNTSGSLAGGAAAVSTTATSSIITGRGTVGDTEVAWMAVGTTPATTGSTCIPAVRVSVSTNTTYYLNLFSTLTSGGVTWSVRLSARRVR